MDSTPRITSQYLDSFTGKVIRILGKVTQIRGTQAVVECEGSVTVHLSQDSHLTPGNAVEIVGKVNQDLTVKVLKATDMGTNIDYGAYHSLVEATHLVKEIFYSPS
ncbi:replication factor A protein 3 [Bisporella sp. PMI_857]|nr:replication factor A protein 3 [Bisporella sp. PMI_857]KAH8600254.1 replication factor A protein 3 [Bisporella sp. PMI_857]